MGVELKARNLAQVSMNLTDFETTSLATVFEAVTQEAAALGVQVVGSEIVGLVPRQALDAAAVQFLRIENFRPELIVENRLEQVCRGQKLETRSSKLAVRPNIKVRPIDNRPCLTGPAAGDGGGVCERGGGPHADPRGRQRRRRWRGRWRRAWEKWFAACR